MTSSPTSSERHARNAAVIEDLAAHGGRTDSGQTLVIVTTIGAKSGREFRLPLCVVEDGADLIIAGSAGGQPTHPQWYVNLDHTPGVLVEYLGETFRATAETVTNSTDRDRLFEKLSSEIIGLYSYQDRCRNQRQIPVVRLRRIAD